ncbi:MAG: 2-succinyl-5-enolpyruvyl-6-hydroxy-3-cyclohexene-1-carboxylic-acid synthase [Brevibacterium sp.]|nr:2-succinyl-5-enolpyruvyl-6-hydroxy-3-cyclohexene-1-carboxylic-acid synthase [Brevibacterium sp.]
MVEYQVMLNSSAVAQQIARGLALSGVTEVVIAPGSRSAPLIYALAPLAEAGVIRMHVRIDERDAGFLALGLARGLRAKQSAGAGVGGAGRGAVALVTTSGSAVANLHPAVLEASYGRLPLIAITADRPARLRGTGANQTIDDQSQVLSDVRARFDVPAGSVDAENLIAEAVVASLGTHTYEAGPVQFNVQFDVPLVPSVTELAEWAAEVKALAPKVAGMRANSPEAETSASVRILPGTVIVAGDAGGHSADSLKSLAEEYSIPVLAEPSSPLTTALRNSCAAVPAHARVLSERGDLRTAIRAVIVHGKPTLTRPVAALLADSEVLVQRLPDDVDAVLLSVSDGAGAVRGASAGEEPRDTSEDRTWREEWVAAGETIVAASHREREVAAKSEAARAITEYLAGRAVNLFAASSNTIRYLSEATDVRAHIHASRGLAGIDGLISTATGLSISLGEQVVLVIGDVAMLHDVGGLLTPSAEEDGNVLIVVLNDDGGAIFSGLEHSQNHVAPYLERYFTVPHGRDFKDLAAAYGWEYAQVGLHDESSLLNDFIAEFEQVQGSVEDGPESRGQETSSGETGNADTSSREQTCLGRRIIEVKLP